VDDHRERARQVMIDLGVEVDAWLRAVDPDSPERIVDWTRQTADAWQRGDLERLLERSDPEIVIVQPRELPDARTYRGHDGVIEALLDWPREWENFQVEPKRIFALDDDRVVVDTVHRGRSLRMGIEIEADIVWLFSQVGELTRRWDMFTSVDQALAAAATDD
jgi:ketosteroid isomerase-like protein